MNELLAAIVVVAALVAIILASGMDYTLRRVWTFQRKRFRRQAEEGRARLLTRMGRPQQYQVDLREIRDFVISLQLGTSMDQTLSGALSNAAQQFKNKSVFGERLATQVESRLAMGPEEVLKGLAADLHSDHLRDLPQRLEMARNGGIPYDRALSLTVSLIEEEIRGDLRRDIQNAPIRLTFPMILGVFLAALVIAVYPLIRAILSAPLG